MFKKLVSFLTAGMMVIGTAASIGSVEADAACAHNCQRYSVIVSMTSCNTAKKAIKCSNCSEVQGYTYATFSGQSAYHNYGVKPTYSLSEKKIILTPVCKECGHTGTQYKHSHNSFSLKWTIRYDRSCAVTVTCGKDGCGYSKTIK